MPAIETKRSQGRVLLLALRGYATDPQAIAIIEGHDGSGLRGWGSRCAEWGSGISWWTADAADVNVGPAYPNRQQSWLCRPKSRPATLKSTCRHLRHEACMLSQALTAAAEKLFGFRVSGIGPWRLQSFLGFVSGLLGVQA